MNKQKLANIGHSLLKFLWIIPFFVLLGQVVYLKVETAIAPQVVVAIRGYDPRSLLSGHYIQYEIDWAKTNCSQFEKGMCPRYVFNQIPHRYYVPQRDARRLDSLLRNRDRYEEPLKFEIIFAYIKGRQPIARMLLINGQEWKEYLLNN